jgi:23S rRNA (adenine2503-C2)-methyltransferase
MAARDVLDLPLDDLERWCTERDAAPFRARQIGVWLYRQGARDFATMSNLPRALREELAASFRIGSLALTRVSRSTDGTQKLLFSLADGSTIESVLIPDGARLTLCISTQVGCGMGCTFCATATLGFRRHLSRGEIVEQFLVARRVAGEGPDPAAADPAGPPGDRVTNLVFMGMGEPLHNYAGTVGAIDTLTSDWGVDFSHRRITVSTVGLVPEMRRLLDDTQVNLAVSLTAVDQDLRRELMPIGKRYPLSELLAACRALPLPRRKRITFEYVMLAGVNDSPLQARTLARALAGIRCKVNLIPFNPFPGSPYARSDEVTVARFQDVLRRAGVHATIRESRGPDIAAACGQLVAEHTARPRARQRAAGTDPPRHPDASSTASSGETESPS